MEPTVKLCPHCIEKTQALTGCGALLEATSHHYAMALIRTSKAERRPLASVIELLKLLDTAPELVPAVVSIEPPAPYLTLTEP